MYIDKYKKVEPRGENENKCGSLSEFQTIPGFFPLQVKKLTKSDKEGTCTNQTKPSNQTKYADQTKPSITTKHYSQPKLFSWRQHFGGESINVSR